MRRLLCFISRVGTLGHQLETVAFEARNNVHVRVMYDLPRVLAVVHCDVDAVGARSFFYRYREFAHCFRDCRPILRRDVENIIRMVFRNYERVSRIHGANIEERNCFIVLVYFVRWELTMNDFTENTIGHTHVSH